MCITTGSKGVSIFDRYRAAAAASPTGKIDVFAKPVSNTPVIKQIVDAPKKQEVTEAAANNAAALGSAAPTAVMGDRIEGTPDEVAQRASGVAGYDDFLGLLGKMLGISTKPLNPIVNDPSRTVQAGRIGHAVSAHDLRIGNYLNG
jgi:hypothetical protein